MNNYRLKPRQKSLKRQILSQKALELQNNGFSYREIALKLNKPIGTISKLISLARTTYQKEVFYSPLTRSKRKEINVLLSKNPSLSDKELSDLSGVSLFNIARVKKNT